MHQIKYYRIYYKVLIIIRQKKQNIELLLIVEYHAITYGGQNVIYELVLLNI